MNHPAAESSLPQRTGTRRSGFTLVELMVTIAIVVVLATLTVVITRNIRDKAHQATATSVLRQVAAFGAAYSTENNGDINTLRWKEDKMTEGRGGKYVADSFWGRLQPYLFADVSSNDQRKMKEELSMQLDTLFSSPDADTMAGTLIKGAKIYHDGSGLPVPLGFNANLHEWAKYRKVSEFGDPALVLYATYGFGFFDVQDGQAYVPTPDDASTPKNNIYYLDDHRAIMVFLDGHVELMAPPIHERNFQ